MKYRYDWRAKCPKCDVKMTSKDYQCQNCEKGHLRAWSPGFLRNNPNQNIVFGCPKCEVGVAGGALQCTKCGAVVAKYKYVRGPFQMALIWTSVVLLAAALAVRILWTPQKAVSSIPDAVPSHLSGESKHKHQGGE